VSFRALFLDIKINTFMNQVFKQCLLFRDLCLILTMFSGCCVWIPHYNGARLAVCDTVTVLLGDIVLLAFEKILVLFPGIEKLHFYNCTNFCLQLHKIFYNCTICAQPHIKKPWCVIKPTSFYNKIRKHTKMCQQYYRTVPLLGSVYIYCLIVPHRNCRKKCRWDHFSLQKWRKIGDFKVDFLKNFLGA